MSKLAQQDCESYQENSVKLQGESLNQLLSEVPFWSLQIIESMEQIERIFQFKNFSEALHFTNQIGNLSDTCNHHPMIITEWGKVTLRWWTHKVQGLHKNDFIMAAKSDETYNP